MPDAIRAVLLDAGNTLVFVDPERVVEVVRDVGVRADVDAFWRAEQEARRTLVSHLGPDVKGTEAHMWKAYFSTLFARLGVPAEALPAVGERIRELHEANHLWSHVPPAVPPALERLADDGYRLAVVSNADGRVESLLEERGLTRHFEFVLDSGVVGVEKPDPRIFREAVERLGVDPGSVLYVGDLYPVDVVGARGAGLDAVLLDPYDLFSERDVVRLPSLEELPDYLAGRLADDGARPGGS